MGATMFGGSVFAEVTDQEFSEVRQGVNSNTERISVLENAQSVAKDYSKDIAANKTAIDNETKARQDADTKLQGSVDANKTAIDAEATARDQAVAQERAERKGADAAQDKVIQQVNQNVADGFKAINNNIGTITNQLNQNDLAEAQTRAAADQTLQNNIDTNADNINKNKQDIAGIQNTLKAANALASANATQAATKAAKDATDAAENANTVAKGLKDRVNRISYNQDVTSESDLITKDQSIGQNLTNVDTALHKEIGARIGADVAQDKRIDNNTHEIEKTNEALGQTATNLGKLNQNVADGFTALNQADVNEAAAREAGDKKLDDRITNVKTYLQDETEKNYVSKGMYNRETSVADGAFVKEGQTVGQNLNAVDKGLNDEIANRIGADAAQDKRINEVNTNVSKGFDTINKNIGTITDQLNKNDLAEQQARAAADKAEADARDQADQKEAAARQAVDQNLQKQIDNNGTSINDLYGRYSSLKTDINKVGARSAALAGLHPLDFDPANKLNFAVASGSFKGENSVALGAFYRPNENIMFSAASTMGDSDNAYTFGLSFKIGPSSAKTKTTSPDAEELYKVVGELQDQLAAQQKEIEQLKADKAK